MGDDRAAGGTRVVLLARPGQACERLREALEQAGAELVLVADPTVGNHEQVIAAAPQAVLVALDPSVEDALDRFESVLANPDITVIFDEAELAAQRAGWDSARWVRHLAAKLNRHQNVLPPGGEVDSEWHPSPGRIEQSHDQARELDIAPFTGEAQQRADHLPSDPGLYVEPLSFTDDLNFDEGEASTGTGFDAARMPDSGLTLAGLDEAGLDLDVEPDIADPDPISFDAGDLEGTDLEASDLEASALEASALDATDLETSGLDTNGREGIAFDMSGLDDAALDVATTGEAVVRARKPAVVHDLEELDRRVSGIELADVDSYGHGPRRGAVLVEAGLGGPDAVRQLLGELPEGFPRPVLIRLRLDGGRYDRLVKQMERATKLSVLLARAGQAAEAGHVYFMAPEFGLAEEKSKLVFSDDAGPSSLFTVLPSNDSAVLFLSGSDPALVETVMNQAWPGALVAGQAPEGCYDAMASTEVIARGGASGSPAELAGQLAERWPS